MVLRKLAHLCSRVLGLSSCATGFKKADLREPATLLSAAICQAMRSTGLSLPAVIRLARESFVDQCTGPDGYGRGELAPVADQAWAGLIEYLGQQAGAVVMRYVGDQDGTARAEALVRLDGEAIAIELRAGSFPVQRMPGALVVPASGERVQGETPQEEA